VELKDWTRAVTEALGPRFRQGAAPEGVSQGVSVYADGEDDAKWVILGEDGQRSLTVRLSMELDEEAYAREPGVREQMLTAVRDLEGLELDERGYEEVHADVLGFSITEDGPFVVRVAEIVFRRLLSDPDEAAREVEWLYSHLGFSFPYEED
jgi:hypothetical protein